MLNFDTKEKALQYIKSSFCSTEIDSKSARDHFLDACKEGKTDLIKAYINIGMPLNFQHGYNEMCPLVKATENQQKAVIDLLLEAGADIEQKDGDGDTALHTAINWQHTKMLNHLIQQGANVNNINKFKWTPITKCIKEGYNELLDILLDSAKIDPNSGAEQDVSALHFAINNNNQGFYVALKMLENGFDINQLYNQKKSLSFIMQAILNSWTTEQKKEFIELFLKKGGDLNLTSTTGMTALDIAYLKKADDLVAFLEKKNAKISDPAIWELFNASIKGELKTVEALIRTGVELDQQDFHGYTVLSRAVQHNHMKIVKILLDAGANPKIADLSQWAPISFCCKGNKFNLFELLLQHGASVNDAPGHSRVLLNSVRYQRPQMLEVLLKDEQLAINTVDTYEQSALVLAANNNDVGMIEQLVQAGIDTELKTNQETTALGVAAYNGKFEAIYALIKAGVDLDSRDKDGKTAVFKLCDKYNNSNEAYADALEALLKAGASNICPSRWQDSPLAAAKSSKNYVCIERLEKWLRYGHYEQFKAKWLEDARPQDNSMMQAYAEICNFEHLNELIQIGEQTRIRALLEAGLSPNPPYPVTNSPLSLAGELGDLETLNLLLKHGADPNFKSRSEETPIFRVAYKGTATSVERLIQAGAELSAISEYNSMPIGWAVSNNNIEVMRLVYEAYPEAIHIVSPLHSAAGQGLLKIVRWFIEEIGIDVDSRNEFGKTPLFSAMGKFHKSVIWYLVEKGAELNTLDKDGESPLYKALQKNKAEIARFLLEQGADPDFSSPEKPMSKAIGSRQELKNLLQEFSKKTFEQNVKAEKIEATEVSNTFRKLYENDLEGLKEILPIQDINKQNYRGDSLFMLAIGLRKWEIAQWLSTHKELDLLLKNKAADTAWTYSTISQRPLNEVFDETTVAVIDEAMDVNQQADLYMRMDALRKAIDNGDLEDVQEILDSNKMGLNFLDSSNSAIFRAIKNKDAVMLEFLLQKGADVNLPAPWGQRYPLERVIELKDDKMLNILLRYGANINLPKSNTFVKAVAEEVPLSLLKSLIKAGAEINQLCPNYQCNALHLAIQNEQLEILQFLIDADADLEKEDSLGNRPLDLAKEQADWVFELLEEEF